MVVFGGVRWSRPIQLFSCLTSWNSSSLVLLSSCIPIQLFSCLTTRTPLAWPALFLHGHPALLLLDLLDLLQLGPALLLYDHPALILLHLLELLQLVPALHLHDHLALLMLDLIELLHLGPALLQCGQDLPCLLPWAF